MNEMNKIIIIIIIILRLDEENLKKKGKILKFKVVIVD